MSRYDYRDPGLDRAYTDGLRSSEHGDPSPYTCRECGRRFTLGEASQHARDTQHAIWWRGQRVPLGAAWPTDQMLAEGRY